MTLHDELLLRGQALSDHRTWHRGSREAGGLYIQRLGEAGNPTAT